MTTTSTRLSVTKLGRTVAQSVLHPRSADELIEYAARRVDDLLILTHDGQTERVALFAFLHAAYSSSEYSSIHGNSRMLPYQLEDLIHNSLADQSERYLMEYPWRRNPVAANAALVSLRWAEGKERKRLAHEFDAIGSGVLQNMFRDSVEILCAWSDCLVAGANSRLVDEDRPPALQYDVKVLRFLRNLASVIRAQARRLIVGVPGEAAWIGGLRTRTTGRQMLSRRAILALIKRELIEPIDLLRHDKYADIVDALRTVDTPNPDDVAKSFRHAVAQYRLDTRKNLWRAAIQRAPAKLRALFEQMIDSRQTDFEAYFETVLVEVGIGCTRLDDGKTAGAPDFLVGTSATAQLVVELKTSEGKNMVGLNGATDVVKGAAIVNMEQLQKVTLANPGFDPNVPWQARNVSDLTLLEACQFAYGVTLLACGEVDKEAFLDWLTNPGMLAVGDLRGAVTQSEM
jgi:helicase